MKTSMATSVDGVKKLGFERDFRYFIGCCTILLFLSTTHAIASEKDRHENHLRSQVLIRSLDKVNFTDGVHYNKSLTFSTGIGSGAFHFPGDDRHTVYTIGDRGVNVKCKDDVKVLGADVCEKGKIFPVTNYSPSIFKLQQQGEKGWKIVETIQIKDSNGKQISGLPNPFTSITTETAFDNQGHKIAFDANGLDTEAMVRLSDGDFWVSDEYAPSLVHLSAGGDILERLVPYGIDEELADARYPVLGRLPDILSLRKLNRGIESLAVSPDETFLYFIMQSPLANPDKKAFKTSRHVRLFKLDLKSKEVVAEYVYVIDTPESFLDDSTHDQSKVKVSEMVAYGDDKLIILERVSHTTKLFKVELENASNILNTAWDHVSTRPTLEQLTVLSTQNIIPLHKKRVLDSATDLPKNALPSKVEGVAILNEHELFLINDNDFGIKGDSTSLINLEVSDDFFE